MKREIFNKYTEQVNEVFRLEDNTIFKKTKKRDIVDARNMLYFLCSRRPMRVSAIQNYMSEGGYDISHTSILYGIKSIEDKFQEDKDYISTIKKIELCVI